PTYGYGILVMPISFYLVWRKRVEVCRSEIKPSFFGLLLFLGVSCIWWVAKIVDVQIMQGLAFIIMIPGLLLTFFGFRVVKIISFPLAYLFIAIPIWSFLEPPLQNITVIIVTSILRLVDVPVFLENNLISIPEGQFFVEESCAGLRIFLVMLTFSLLYVYLYFNNYLRSVIYIIVALGVSLMVNWVRVFLVILAGHVDGMNNFLVHDHVTFGWVIFGLSLIPLLWFGTILQGKELLSGGLSNNKGVSNAPNRSYNKATYIALCLSVAFISLFTSLSAQWINKGEDKQVTTINIVAPSSGGSWVGPIYQDETINPTYTGADAEAAAVYRINSQSVGLYIAYYANQRQGKEVVSDMNSNYDRNKWIKYGERLHAIPVKQDKEYNVKEIDLRSVNGRKRLLWQWYYTGGLFTPDRYFAKLLQVFDKLGGSKGAAAIILAAEYDENPDEARLRMNDFFNKVILKIDSHPDDIMSSLITTL
ncbi:MAG: EpsI family protein, partial [Gammaproteobacteria bacterium]|nr:EpsI family protein [Gammaproteobacteria bacterium]